MFGVPEIRTILSVWLFSLIILISVFPVTVDIPSHTNPAVTRPTITHMPLAPPLNEGHVVGVGYRPRSGTIRADGPEMDPVACMSISGKTTLFSSSTT
jgi:hypothetical protein